MSEPSEDEVNEAAEAAQELPAPGEGAVRAGGLGVEEARAWSGSGLDEIGGNGVGKIEGVWVDEKTGEPEWLQVRLGRFGHHSLVPARDAVAGVSRVWVPYSRDEIRAAPRLEPGQPLSRDREREFLEAYGIASQTAGRGAELAKRETDETTIRPA